MSNPVISVSGADILSRFSEVFVFVSGGTVYQPVTVVTPQGQMVTQALSPGTIRVQNNQVPQL